MGVKGLIYSPLAGIITALEFHPQFKMKFISIKTIHIFNATTYNVKPLCNGLISINKITG